jgi:hypothetical protein
VHGRGVEDLVDEAPLQPEARGDLPGVVGDAADVRPGALVPVLGGARQRERDVAVRLPEPDGRVLDQPVRDLGVIGEDIAVVLELEEVPDADPQLVGVDRFAETIFSAALQTAQPRLPIVDGGDYYYWCADRLLTARSLRTRRSRAS